MDRSNMLDGKKVLIVDDEPDVLDTLEDLLPQCDIVRAADYQEAKAQIENRSFDLAILDIMGVQGYDLLQLCREKNVTAIMLTAYALTPQDVKKSYSDGAASYVPKEEMVNIQLFLADVLEAKEKGTNTWGRWYERLAAFCEKKFGRNWKDSDKPFWDNFPFY